MTDNALVFIGTQDTGVHAARLDAATGRLSPAGLIAEIERPTWVLPDPRKPRLFAVSEVGNAGDRTGDVFSFAVDVRSGTLREAGRTPSAGGGPTHLAITPDGRNLFVANFGGGQVAVVPVVDYGSLRTASSVQQTFGNGPHRRQQGPHAHGVTLDPSGSWLLVPDMGSDRIFLYRYDGGARQITPHEMPYLQLPAGCGPRLVLFGRDGRYAYLLSELSAEIFVLEWDAPSGTLAPRGSVAMDPPHMEGRSAAAFAISADGRFLYASNRRTHAIHVFAIDAENGGLREVQVVDAGGIRPWAVEIAPGERWMLIANQGSDTVNVCSVDPVSGCLGAVSDMLEIPTPTSFAVIPSDLTSS
ncbi:lactonase family protein [Sphingomonas oryzagri]|uniref:Lactonase family protein n=1 Tax=Sphingomonas oryzagri TaxID=3042314 RepID=A0ABT6N2L4_9SPHN|nr:lactonase family protein [Sphingomonas oryzagri]MDH7639281.1 lactonase family protein [Sphingomonas oryzagri]